MGAEGTAKPSLGDDSVALLRELCQIHAVSGREDSLARKVREMVEPYADELTVDALGNVIAHKKGEGTSKVMVAAHMDEIGLMVRHVDERGFLFISPVGGNRAQNLFARLCVVKTDDERLIPGLINHPRPGRPRGLKKLPEVEEFFVDVGASSREETEDMGIEVGDTVSIQYEFGRLGSHRLMGKAFDDRALVSIQIEAMRLLSEDAARTPDLYFVFTTQEEVGCRGAKTAAYSINPDLAIALDITVSGDIPGTPPEEAITELDKGPAIKVMDRLSNSHMGLIAAPSIVRQLKSVAREHEIPHQLEVFMAGSTDAATMHTERGGIPSGAILLPTRYVHAHEVVSGRDMAHMRDLLVHYLQSLG
jgi:endoglucanase